MARIPILQSNMKMKMANTMLLTMLEVKLTSITGPEFSRSPSTVDRMPESSPWLLSLKYPIGILLILSAMAIRLFATMKYPAWVCCSWLNLFVAALPRTETAMRTSAVNAGLPVLSFPTRAIMMKYTAAT